MQCPSGYRIPHCSLATSASSTTATKHELCPLEPQVEAARLHEHLHPQTPATCARARAGGVACSAASRCPARDASMTGAVPTDVMPKWYRTRHCSQAPSASSATAATRELCPLEPQVEVARLHEHLHPRTPAPRARARAGRAACRAAGAVPTDATPKRVLLLSRAPQGLLGCARHSSAALCRSSAIAEGTSQSSWAEPARPSDAACERTRGGGRLAWASRR
jgi:hypothetical protein